MTTLVRTTLARILAIIADRPLPYAGIAERVGVSKQWATTCVRELAELGWAEARVESWAQETGGRWRYVIAATDEGRQALEDEDERLVGPVGDLSRRSPRPRPVRVTEMEIGRLYAERRYD